MCYQKAEYKGVSGTKGRHRRIGEATMTEPLKLTIPKIDFLKIVSLLDDFGKLCEEKGIKFNKYTEAQLLEVLYAYRNYRGGDKPPF